MLTIIFTASLMLIILMLGLKRFEENRRNKLFVPDLRMRADVFVSKIIQDVNNFFAILSGKNAKLFAIFIANLMLSEILKVKRKLGIKKLKFLDSLKKDKNANKKKGPPSFFLKNMSEYKSNYLK